MKRYAFILGILMLAACGRTGEGIYELDAAYNFLGTDFPLEPPLDYSSSAPDYITRDNRLNGDVDNRKATLGRVLFYDRQLSLNNSIACGSCHIQSHAFGDSAQQSIGLDGGVTSRQSMRLVNTRYAELPSMFWDRRALSLGDQVLQPIQDHIEMGFSGSGDQPGLDSLISRLQGLQHYSELFDWAFQEDGLSINASHLAEVLENFVSSIVSFDSKFDRGFSESRSVQVNFQNFTAAENRGKSLFLTPPQLSNQNVRTGGGVGCAGCHRPPEFDIDPGSANNGVDHEAGNPQGFDTTNTKSPTLRDVFNSAGIINTPMMHTGDFLEFTTIIEHYNEVIPNVDNRTVDPRLVRGVSSIQMELTTSEREDLELFIKTLTGSDIYSDTRWSSPF